MTPTIHSWTSRSKIEDSWKCNRRRYFSHYHLGTGITPEKTAHWLDVGTAVHIGLMYSITGDPEKGIREALDYWEGTEQRQWLREVNFFEQGFLIEALLRGFNTFSLPTFLDTYQVIAAELEITEPLSSDLTMMSKPDAIVMDKRNGEVAGISWKTIDSPTEFRRGFHRDDLQAIMEAYYASKWLESKAGRQAIIDDAIATLKTPEGLTTEVLARVARRLSEAASAPTKVDYIQTIYLVKGPRTRIAGEAENTNVEGDEVDGAWINTISDKEFYDGAWRQDTFLVYPWVYSPPGTDTKKKGVRASDRDELGAISPMAWAFRYQKPGNKTKSTIGKDYKRGMITVDTYQSVKEWIELLNDRKVFPSTFDPNVEHPLSKVVVWEEPQYINPKFSEKILRQVKRRELRNHDAFVELQLAVNDVDIDGVPRVSDEEIEILLDDLFDQNLTACKIPFSCEYRPLCFETFLQNPPSYTEPPQGYKTRVPHYKIEREQGQ